VGDDDGVADDLRVGPAPLAVPAQDGEALELVKAARTPAILLLNKIDCLKDKRLLIHDRDPLYTKKFGDTLKAAGVRCLKMPHWSPNLNSYCESWIRGAKRECLNKVIFFGERHVRYVVEQYVSHVLGSSPDSVPVGN
jgi:hypothetical protein